MHKKQAFFSSGKAKQENSRKKIWGLLQNGRGSLQAIPASLQSIAAGNAFTGRVRSNPRIYIKITSCPRPGSMWIALVL